MNWWIHIVETVRAETNATNWNSHHRAQSTHSSTQIKRFWLADESSTTFWWIKMQQLINCTYLILLIGASARRCWCSCHSFYHNVVAHPHPIWSCCRGVEATSALHMYFARAFCKWKTTNEEGKAINQWHLNHSVAARMHIVHRSTTAVTTRRQQLFLRKREKKCRILRTIPWFIYGIWIYRIIFGFFFDSDFSRFFFAFFQVPLIRIVASILSFLLLHWVCPHIIGWFDKTQHIPTLWSRCSSQMWFIHHKPIVISWAICEHVEKVRKKKSDLCVRWKMFGLFISGTDRFVIQLDSSNALSIIRRRIE